MRYNIQVFAMGMLCIFYAETPFAAVERLAVEGSSTIGPSVKEWSKKFARKEKISLKVEGGGSGHGIKCAKEKKCDIGMASKSVEADKASPAKVVNVGWDGLAFATNKDTGVANLTKEQIKDIFSGKTKNWKEVGGADKKIVPFQRGKSAGEQSLFQKIFQVKSNAESIGSNQKAINKVRGTSGSVTFMSLGIALKNSDKINIVQFNGIDATPTNLNNGTYDLKRELVLLYREDNKKIGTIKKFVESYRANRNTLFQRYGFISE